MGIFGWVIAAGKLKGDGVGESHAMMHVFEK